MSNDNSWDCGYADEVRRHIKRDEKKNKREEKGARWWWGKTGVIWWHCSPVFDELQFMEKRDKHFIYSYPTPQP